MSHYTLGYWNTRAIGEPIRLVLACNAKTCLHVRLWCSSSSCTFYFCHIIIGTGTTCFFRFDQYIISNINTFAIARFSSTTCFCWTIFGKAGSRTSSTKRKLKSSRTDINAASLATARSSSFLLSKLQELDPFEDHAVEGLREEVLELQLFGWNQNAEDWWRVDLWMEYDIVYVHVMVRGIK